MTINSELVDSIAAQTGYTADFVKILVGRGLTTPQAISDFLFPNIDRFDDPYGINGIKDAAERIKRAIANDEKVLIYGDYDCDGISAISVLMLYLSKRISNVSYFIPNRNTDGYGMSVESLSSVIAADKPSLVISVDCGVTAVKEVEYLKKNGVDVIITDHHEPPQILPDCIVVDPKIQKDGCFHDYCGAGVVFKLVQALAPKEETNSYLDIVAIATVADIVPLVGENRLIASYGIKMIRKKPRLGLSLMLGGKNKCTSYDIMFKLAPRINAAGRMDTAMKAVDLFLSQEHFTLSCLVQELGEDNVLRQQKCEEVVEKAKAKLKNVDFDSNRIILLHDEDWESGVLGIAAARLADDFCRPTILFGLRDGELKGSARSVKAINIFEVLTKHSNYFENFGGHAQAAGVTMKVEQFEAFSKEINAYLLHNFDDSLFVQTSNCDLSVDKSIMNDKFINELELLEPTGYGNPRPQFLMNTDGLNFQRLGQTKHVKYSASGYEIVGFSKLNQIYALKCPSDLEMSLSINDFQNCSTVQGIVKNVFVRELRMSEQTSNLANLYQFSLNNRASAAADCAFIDDTEAVKLADTSFGTVFVAFSQAGYEDFADMLRAKVHSAELPIFVGNSNRSNPVTAIMVCPNSDFDYSFYSNVVFVERPTDAYLNGVCSNRAKVFLLKNCREMPRPELDAETLRSVYKELWTLSGTNYRYCGEAKLLQRLGKSLKSMQFDKFVACLTVLGELGLYSISDRGILNVKNNKTDLNNSTLFVNIGKGVNV